MQKYIEYITQTTPYLLSGIGLFAFLYSCRKSEPQKGNRFFWGGMMTLSLPMLFVQVRRQILPNQEYAPFFHIVSIACLVCGIYLTRKGNKMIKEAAVDTPEIRKLKDISKPVGLVFGIITIPFSAIAIFAALIAFIGIITTGQTTYEWPLIVGWVFLGVLSVFLSVVSWRLMNVRKGWTGKLFSPYMLWVRIAGWLFLVAGFIKLIQRNLTGIWAIVVAIALIYLSGLKETKIAKTD